MGAETEIDLEKQQLAGESLSHTEIDVQDSEKSQVSCAPLMLSGSVLTNEKEEPPAPRPIQRRRPV